MEGKMTHYRRKALSAHMAGGPAQLRLRPAVPRPADPEPARRPAKPEFDLPQGQDRSDHGDLPRADGWRDPDHVLLPVQPMASGHGAFPIAGEPETRRRDRAAPVQPPLRASLLHVVGDRHLGRGSRRASPRVDGEIPQERRGLEPEVGRHPGPAACGSRRSGGHGTGGRGGRDQKSDLPGAAHRGKT